MKRSILLFVMLFTCIAVFAADVDEDELKTVNRGSVEFINYTGPHDRIDTRQEIINIGVSMGRAIKKGARKGNNRNKYIAIHLPDASEGKIGADIIILTENAGVDHVRNLRFILAGYIMTVYDYSFDQSFLLAEFVTIYNAVYRKNMQKFESRYTAAVFAELDSSKAGLSTRYNEWAGKSQIVIPLNDGSGRALSSGDLTDEEVIDEMRSQEDMGVESRKGMVDLQEEELQGKEKDLLEDKEAVDEEREDIDREKQEIEEDRDRLDEQEKDLEKDKQGLEEREEEIERMEEGPEKEAEKAKLEQDKKEVEEREKQIEKDREDVEKRSKSSEERESDLEEKEKEVSRRQDDLEKQQENLQREREQVARDEQKLEEEGKSVKAPDYVLFIKADENSDSKSGQLVVIDANSGTIEKTSGLTNLRNRMFQLVNKTVVCISGTGKDANLVLFDLDDLSIIRRSDVNVYENTYLRYENGILYAVVRDGSKWYIGTFDKALNYVSRSDGEVDKYTAIVVADGQVIAQRPDGGIRILTKDSFKKAE